MITLKSNLGSALLSLGLFAFAGSLSISSTQADISWNGSAGNIGPIPFGGFPYCNYQVTLQNVQMALTSTANGYSSSVQFIAVEQSLNGCQFPPTPPNGHHYSANGANITKNGNNFHIVYSPDVLNAPQCSLVFDGTLSDNSISGDLTLHRIDQPSPLDWTATPFIQIFTAPPQITCPADITVCPSEGTDPNITGSPTIISSCSPVNQVQFFKNDGPSFNGTFARTWTAVDPICGTSQACTQFITVLEQDNPTVDVTPSNDALLLTLHARGTRGAIIQANWQLNGNPLNEGPGVHFLDVATVEVDLTVYPLDPGPFFVNVSVQTSCTAFGGGSNGGSAPTPYSLSRTLFSAPSANPGSGNRPVTVTCTTQSTFGPASRSFRFQASDSGAALIQASSPTARLVVLAPNTSLTQPIALACGTKSLRFLASSGTTYAVIVDPTEAFTMTSQIFDPTKIIALNGPLAFGTVGTGTQTTRTLTIANNGTLPLNVTGISYPAGYSGDWSGGLVQPGTPQNVTVTFNPSSAGTYNGNIVVTSDATGVNTIAVSGSAIFISTKALGLSGNLAFGSLEIGSSKNLDFTIKNTGNTAFTVSSIQCPPGFTGNWSGSIAPGASQPVTITFTPGAITTYTGNIVVNSDATGNNTLAVSGTGAPQSLIRAVTLKGNLNFGPVLVNTTATLSFTISNTGNNAISVSSIQYPDQFSGDWNGGPIFTGDSKTVNVQFTPKAETAYSGNIVVVSDATGNNAIAVSGLGTLPPSRTISLSGNLAFGNVVVGSSKTGTLTIENTGNSVLTVSNIIFPEAVTGDWSSGQIPPHSSRVVTVTFRPTRSGAFTGNVQVVSDASSGGNTFAIQGAGLIVAFLSSELKPPADGLFQVSVGAPAGKTLILEGSADFKVWTQVARLPTFGFQIDLNDLVPKNARARFYRFRLE